MLFSLSITKKKYPLNQSHHFFLPSKFLKSFYKSCTHCSLWWGLPNSTGNQNQTERERERGWENSKRETNHTLFFFSILLRPKLKLCLLSLFLLHHRDSLHPFQVKEAKKKRVKLQFPPLHFY